MFQLEAAQPAQSAPSGPGELHAHSPPDNNNAEEGACAASDSAEAGEDASESTYESDESSEWETASGSSDTPLDRHFAGGGDRRTIVVNSFHNEPIDVAAYIGTDVDEPVFTRQRDRANTEQPGVVHALPSRTAFQPGAANVRSTSCK